MSTIHLGSMVATLGVDTTGLMRANVAMQTWSKKTTTSLNSMSQRFRTFGYLASAAITAPIVLGAKAMVTLANNYESSLSKVIGLVGIARTQVEAWSKSILKMAPEVAKGPEKLADALYFITSGGIRGSEAMEVL